MTPISFSSLTCPAPLIAFLQEQREKLRHYPQRARPWLYHELHNPWSPAASVYDSWQFLELCQAPFLITQLKALLGQHIILYDSQWLESPWSSKEDKLQKSEAHRFPVEPLAGVTAFVYFDDAANERTYIEYQESCQTGSAEMHAGSVIIIGSEVRYTIHSNGAKTPSIYVIRYFPASSLYSRHPASPAQALLTLRYPLLNYSRLPLWLVCGEDQADNDFVTGFETRSGFWARPQ